jgi:NAD-dependent deacetylase
MSYELGSWVSPTLSRMSDSISAAVDALAGATRLLVFTGAGISTESGIPDFRGPDGVWTRVDPDEFTIERYLERRETRVASWRNRGESGVLDALPNPGHHALVRLWESGKMLGCVTQNIDGLHQAAGLPDEAVIELHGNARHTVCTGCGVRSDTAEIIVRVEGGDEDPHCGRCGSPLKVDVVFFGEAMPVDAMLHSHDLAEQADGVLVIGSTLSVFPAAYIPLAVVDNGHPMVIVNRGETDFDTVATAKIEAAAGEAIE